MRKYVKVFILDIYNLLNQEKNLLSITFLNEVVIREKSRGILYE